MSILVYILIQALCAVAMRHAYQASDIAKKVNVHECKLRYNNHSRLVLLATYVIYIVFALSREISSETGGIDAVFYQDYYYRATVSFAEYSQICTQEIGFRLLMWSMCQLGLHFRVLLFVIHTFIFVSICEFNKYMVVRRESPVSLLCSFLIASELFYAFCLLRHAVAIGLAMIFFVLISRKKFKLALIPMLVALTIHISSFILVVVYVGILVAEKLVKQDLGKLLLCLGAVVVAEALLFPLSKLVVRNTKYAMYIDNGGVAWGVFAFVVVVSVAIVLLYHNKNINENVRVEMLMALLAWCCLPLQINYGILYRTLIYFLPLLYKLLPALYDQLGVFPVNARLVGRKCIVEIDPFLDLNITRESWKKAQTYISTIKLLLMVAMIGYLVIRSFKTYTTDYVSYGLYPYILAWFH